MKQGFLWTCAADGVGERSRHRVVGKAKIVVSMNQAQSLVIVQHQAIRCPSVEQQKRVPNTINVPWNP